ncbi:MAG: low molecular weight phosphotyrosine protein phosphatase [Acholeplasmataceae bacterium]|nr:low molecular weight phosphotyrosine protein phosphatase [Acholeplasmataceae bacterium]
MIRVLFVCLGNICRSPMAEGIFKKMIKDEGLEKHIIVESRATSTWEEGNPPHPETIKILNRLGVDHSRMFSTIIQKVDFDAFDYIIGMDHENIGYLMRHAEAKSHKVHLLRDISRKTRGEIVPDPYYNGKYEETYQLLHESLKLWLKKLKKEHLS